MTQSNILFIGMDVHKDSIVLSLADDDRTDVRRYGSIGGTLSDFKKTLRKLVSTGKDLFFCYEAGPTGYELYRFIVSLLRWVSNLVFIQFSFEYNAAFNGLTAAMPC